LVGEHSCEEPEYVTSVRKFVEWF